MTVTTYSDEDTARLVTRYLAGLIREAQQVGASADTIADLWALRALPVEQQLRRLPEWRQVRAEWRQAVALTQ
jgi:hypothetical protein